MCPNTLFSGGPEGNIKIWDYKYTQLNQTINAHEQGGCSNIMVFENPLSSETYDDFYILSFGEKKGDVVMCQPKNNKVFELF